MYTNLELENFKAFQELDIELRPLTLLSGMNGMGKSTVLQSLLLLRQSYLQRAIATSSQGLNLILNGDLIELGMGRDVFFRRDDYVADSQELRFTLTDQDVDEFVWEYEYDSRADVLKPSQTYSKMGDLIYGYYMRERELTGFRTESALDSEKRGIEENWQAYLVGNLWVGVLKSPRNRA